MQHKKGELNQEGHHAINKHFIKTKLTQQIKFRAQLNIDSKHDYTRKRKFNIKI